MSKIDSNGYQLIPEEQIVSDIKTIVEESFIGINTANESPFGNFSLLLASEIDNGQKDAFNVFNSFDLDSASGQDLDYIGKLIGLSRRALEPSILTVQATSSATGYTILEGSQFFLTSDDTILFQNTSDELISTSPQDITMGSLEFVADGDVAVGDKLTSVSNYPDLTDLEITNIIQGEEEETDYSYRLRLKAVRNGNSGNGLESIEKALQEVSGVLDSIVFDVNRDNTITRGFIEAVVLGGTDADIANTIWDNLDMGTETQGTTTEGITDSKGNPININFSRPDDLNTTFVLNVNLITSLSQQQREDIVTAFEDLCNQTFIGGTLYYQDFYGAIVDVITGTARIDTLTINGATNDIIADTREKITPTGVDPNTSIIIV
jgi:uncharacterized phage protein gp47/JayE